MDSDKYVLWKPSVDQLSHLNWLRAGKDLAEVHMDDIRTVGDWQEVVNELAEGQGGKRPIKAGWTFSKCDERFLKCDDEDFRRQALEALYIAVDPGGGGILSEEAKARRVRLLQLIDELAIELVGGVPEESEQYT